jgi:hypothetical protein
MLPWLSSCSIARSSCLIFSSCSGVRSPLGIMGALELEQPTKRHAKHRNTSDRTALLNFTLLLSIFTARPKKMSYSLRKSTRD